MTNSTIFLQLKEFDVLKSLSDSEIEQLSSDATMKRVKKNKMIYSYGEEAEFVYLLNKGKVKMGMNSNSGKTLIKEILFNNSLFGENIFLADQKRKEFCKAMVDTSIICIPKAAFSQVVQRNPQFANEIMGVIIQRLQNLEQRMKDFVFVKAKQRILNFITKMGDLRGIRIGLDEILVNHGLSHKEIAHLTDTSRQTVARVLGELKKENIIHFSSRKPSKILLRNCAIA